MFPLSFGIIRDEFPPEKVGARDRHRVSSVFGVGGGVGLVLSGVIIEHLSWHWLFLIGAVPVLVVDRADRPVRPRVADQDARPGPDYLGGGARCRRRWPRC